MDTKKESGNKFKKMDVHTMNQNKEVQLGTIRHQE